MAGAGACMGTTCTSESHDDFLGLEFAAEPEEEVDIVDTKEGEGPAAESGDTVTMTYKGKLDDGRFDPRPPGSYTCELHRPCADVLSRSDSTAPSHLSSSRFASTQHVAQSSVPGSADFTHRRWSSRLAVSSIQDRGSPSRSTQVPLPWHCHGCAVVVQLCLLVPSQILEVAAVGTQPVRMHM